jgi:hypothetical protein
MGLDGIDLVAIGVRDLTGRDGTGMVVLVAVTPDLEVVARDRADLAPADTQARVYHVIRGQDPTSAQAVLDRVTRQVQAAAAGLVARWAADLQERGYRPVRWAIPVDTVRPGTGGLALADVLASHTHLHTAELELYREVLGDAVQDAGAAVVRYDPATLDADAPAAIGLPLEVIRERVTAEGKRFGRPWQKAHKEAATAAWIAAVDMEPLWRSVATLSRRHPADQG